MICHSIKGMYNTKEKQVREKFPQNIVALQSDFYPSSEITSSQQPWNLFSTSAAQVYIVTFQALAVKHKL